MQFNRNPHEHAAMPDVPVYTQQQLDTATQAAERAYPEQARRRRQLAVIDIELVKLVENTRQMALDINSLMADVLALNERVRNALQERV